MLKQAIFLSLMCLCLGGCGVVKGSSNWVVDGCIKVWDKVYPSDNQIEEKIEDVIEATTSLEVDLSPTTPDPDDKEGK